MTSADRSESRIYTSEIGKLHYVVSSLNASEHLILLHGFTGSAKDFLQLPDSIYQQYSCLMPDLPGHGQTDVEAIAFDTAGQVTLLHQWLNSLAIKHVHLFGYSMGGRLALQFALRYPHRVQSLILVSATAGIESETERRDRVAADDRLAQKILQSSPDKFLRQWLAQPLFKGVGDRGQAFVEQEIIRRLPIQPQGLACSLKYFGSSVMPSVWSELPALQMPTLIVVGNQDQKYLKLGKRLALALPKATFVSLDTTHAPMIEAPDRLWHCVTNFLKAVVSNSKLPTREDEGGDR